MCGTPIVTSKVYGLKELAGDAAVLVDPEDPDEIATAIGRVLSDESLRDELKRRALARAELFSWEKWARRTLALLEEVAGQSSRP